MPLPSCGETGDVSAISTPMSTQPRQVIVEAEAPVVLCGHSYGGMVITQAGADQRVAQLLYVTSMMPEAGQSLADLAGSTPAPWMDPGDDGTVGVHADLVRELFLQDCDEATVREALARLTRQSAMPFAQPPRQIAWKEKPSTYFVCTEDLAIPAELQRRRAGHRRPAGRPALGPPPIPVPARGLRAQHCRRDPVGDLTRRPPTRSPSLWAGLSICGTCPVYAPGVMFWLSRNTLSAS